MKADKDLRILIIGLGYLMEYMAPCYTALLGDNVNTNLVAVTADEADLPRKRNVFGFDILLHDNAEGLRRARPDIILFAPPPSLAMGIAEADLKPYYDELRKNGLPLPEIYAFPPQPLGEAYLDLLGPDVLVANILPNMNTRIGSLDVSGEGYSRLTLPVSGPWPPEREERIRRFLAPLGRVFRFTPEELAVAVSSSSCTQTLTDFAFILSDASNGSISHNAIAEAMRASHRSRYTPPVPSTPCSLEAVPQPLGDALAEVLRVFADTVKQEMRGHGLRADLADELQNIHIDIKLHAVQREERFALERDTRKQATRGGILEKAYIEFYRHVAPLAHRFPLGHGEYPDAAWFDAFREAVRTMVRVAIDHTRFHLADPLREVECTMEHHAALYGLLAREAIRRCGSQGESVLVEATERYARERGGRMRQNAVANGDELEPHIYRLYREWSDPDGRMKTTTASLTPSYVLSVTRCGWLDAWKKHGLLEYAPYFCRTMDRNLYSAFREDLVVTIPKNMGLGDDECVFDWGFAMTDDLRLETEAKAAQYGTKFTRDFSFHTGHVLRTVGGDIRGKLGEEGQEAYEAAAFEFIKRFGVEYLLAAEKAYTPGPS